MTRYLLIAIAVLSLLLTATGFFLKKAIQREGVAIAQRDGYEKALKTQSENVKQLDAILLTRERERTKAQRAAASWRKKWNEAQRNDEDCQKWSNTPLPACVKRVFQLPGPSGSGEAPSVKPDGTHPNP